MKKNIYTKSYSSKRFWLTMVTILWGTKFFGFAPIADRFPIGFAYNMPLLLFFIYMGYNVKEKSEYTKWVWIFLSAIILNCLSSFIFRGTSFHRSFTGLSFTVSIFFFFIFAKIRPNITEIEKVIKCSGIIALLLYYIQFVLLPTPILESLTSGWRANENVGDYDIKRFAVTGEAVIFLYGFTCLNKLLEKNEVKKLFVVLAVIGMAILHGYRGFITAFIIAAGFLYITGSTKRIGKKTVIFFVVSMIAVWLFSNIPIFSDMLAFMIDKNEHQSTTDIADFDRVVELEYFFNYYLVSPFEWICGSGFIGKDDYTNSVNILSFINWVDLGFIGMTFMGGIYMVVCWIWLLCLNLREVPQQYRYINAFSIFLIAGSIVMSAAFSNQALVIEALVFYLCYRVRMEYQEKLGLKR